jgi:4Fe-4S binding protein
MSIGALTRSRWLGAFLLAALPVTAAAHGDGPAAGQPAVAGRVSVQGLRIELLTDPAPLRADRAGRVMARIWRDEPAAADPHADHAMPADPHAAHADPHAAHAAPGTAPADPHAEHAAPATSPALPLIGADVRITIAPAGAAAEPVRVVERGSAGVYPLVFTPSGGGPLHVRVAIVRAGGEPLISPITADFELGVAAPTGWPWWSLVGVTLIAALGLASMRLGVRRGAGAPLDLLAVPRLARVLTAPMLKPALQLPTLLATAAVIFLGLVDVQDAGANVAPRLTWTIWWAGVIFTLVVAGRVWCVVCPFGALNEWTARATGAWRRLPRGFRNLWWAIAAFMLLTWADEMLGVVRRPAVTAWILVAIAAAAVAVGLRYERRSFCRYLCPIGGVLGLYAMTAPVELRARSDAVCRAHREKSCYRGTDTAPGCQMFEFPQALDRNTYCTFCLDCARGCTRDNIALRTRALGRDLWASGHRALDEAYLAVTLVGLTLILTARMLPAWAEWIAALGRRLPATAWTTTVLESAVLMLGSLVVAPLLLLGAAALANRLAGAGAIGVRRTFVAFAYMFVPVALALHLAHNLSHLLMEGPGIVPAVQRAVSVFTPWSLGQPDWHVPALAGASAINVLQTVVITGFFALALLAGQRLALGVYADGGVAGRAVVPFVLLALLFVAAGLLLLGQPMAMRHTM